VILVGFLHDAVRLFGAEAAAGGAHETIELTNVDVTCMSLGLGNAMLCYVVLWQLWWWWWC
jgi:hypothetical protein